MSFVLSSDYIFAQASTPLISFTTIVHELLLFDVYFPWSNLNKATDLWPIQSLAIYRRRQQQQSTFKQQQKIKFPVKNKREKIACVHTNEHWAQLKLKIYRNNQK